MFVFAAKDQDDDEQYTEWSLLKRVLLKDMDEFKNVCMQFHFKNGDNNSLLFVKSDLLM